MEAQSAELSEGSQWFSFVGAHDALGIILHHLKTVSFRNVHDLVHLAAHAGIVHRSDHLRLFRDGILDQILVDIHGVGTDVHKHDLCSPQHKGISRGDKGVGGHDHFIPLFDITKECRHLKGVGTGGGKETFCRPCLFFQKRIALFGKFPITADVHALHCFFHIFHFFSGIRRYIETNHLFLHSKAPRFGRPLPAAFYS